MNDLEGSEKIKGNMREFKDSLNQKYRRLMELGGQK